MCLFKLECRKSILVVCLFLSLSGVALAETTHKAETCGETPACILTVFKSFVKAVQDSGSGVSFSVSH